MHLHRRIKIQLAVLTIIALVAVLYMGVHFMKLPSMLFGVGRYTVTMEIPKSGGLYESGNVTYRGTEVGRVESVGLTEQGVQAVLSLESGIDIPSDLIASVHSQSAIGEQYVDLRPRTADSPPLKDGDVIALGDTTVPPDINSLIAAANRGLEAVPNDNLKTVIDESYTAVGGLGPELSRIVRGSTDLAIAARENLDPLIALIEKSRPVLESQTTTSEAIQSWAANLATITTSLKTHDGAVSTVLEKGGPAAEEVRQLVDRVRPTLPLVMANLVSVGEVALDYQDNIEQLLVLFPQVIAAHQAGIMANRDTKQAYRGQYLSFNLNLNLPPPCTTGFLPAQQRRVPAAVDYPERAPGDLYCRIPQDSEMNVRGARNTPCPTVPGKRAPTAALCESDEQYAPLNNGHNWKGDPNATMSGQAVPQLPPGAPAPAAEPPPPPVAAAEYNPATGTYLGPDGREYTRSDLAQNAPQSPTWQSMLTPPES